MILERFYDEKLAQASYLIGCQAAKSALVVDPHRDISVYLEAAKRHRVRITHVSETHIHADFVSGSRALAAATGAALHLSDEGGKGWRYTFPEARDAVLLRDGDRFEVGNIVIQALHTPGHTPEHLTFLVTDTAAADEPIGALTGDFLFVGDVGRPDLLERAAKQEGTMEAAARDLFRSIRRFREQPDWLQIWPGHGAGSACGKGMSAIPHSTVGYERRFNDAFRADDEEAFVRDILSGQPEAPRYFAEMKRVNRDDPPVEPEWRTPPRIDRSGLEERIAADGGVVDARPAREFAAGHLPGAINIPLDRSFNTWAGWLLGYDRKHALVLPAEQLEEAVRDLAMIGLDRTLAGWAEPSAALEAGAARMDRIDVDEMKRRWEAGEPVVDVRNREEWISGHVPGVPNVFVGEIVERMAEVPNSGPVSVHCESGARSAIAASVLQAAGREVLSVKGGFGDWREAGYPVEEG
jgi:hydroxyacylglutathione hydrolase